MAGCFYAFLIAPNSSYLGAGLLCSCVDRSELHFFGTTVFYTGAINKFGKVMP